MQSTESYEARKANKNQKGRERVAIAKKNGYGDEKPAGESNAHDKTRPSGDVLTNGHVVLTLAVTGAGQKSYREAPPPFTRRPVDGIVRLFLYSAPAFSVARFRAKASFSFAMLSFSREANAA